MKSLSERFWEKVSPEPMSGCWLWTASLNAAGYGQIAVSASRPMVAHRVSLLLHGIELIEGLEVDHLCRTRCCVNPAHLEQVTHRTNLRRSDRGRQTHCKRGHPLTSDNLHPSHPTRDCKRCDTLRHHERYFRNIELSRANDRKWRLNRKLKLKRENEYA